MLGVNIAFPFKYIPTKLVLAYFSMSSFNDRKTSNSKLTIMDQQFKNYIRNTSGLGIIILKKTSLTMSNWSSEAVNQRRNNIITKGKNGRQQTIEILPVYVYFFFFFCCFFFCFFLYICFNQVYTYKYCLE